MKRSLWNDGRLIELRRLADRERELTEEALRTREAFAALVLNLLPAHATKDHVQEVVAASGYSKTLIEGIRTGEHPWISTKRIR